MNYVQTKNLVFHEHRMLRLHDGARRGSKLRRRTRVPAETV